MKKLLITENLLFNPSFEIDTNADGLADEWIDEHTTVNAYTYSLVTTGAVEGNNAQRMKYTGTPADNGTKKVEIYQFTPIGAFQAGDTAEFSVWISGSQSNAYTTIVLESHDSSNAWIGEVEKAIVPTSTPQLFSITYLLPANSSRVVAVIQNPEIYPNAAIDLKIDMAILRKYQPLT